MVDMILDVCCGSKMFYFNKQDERVLFGDIRKENHILCDGRALEIKPDVIFDFKCLPFKSGQFDTVVFDPPHLVNAGVNGWQALKYGKLDKNWGSDLRAGFAECFRVLKRNGALIFKWNETQIKLPKILALTDEKPIFGHISGKRANTHWVMFCKK